MLSHRDHGNLSTETFEAQPLRHRLYLPARRRNRARRAGAQLRAAFVAHLSLRPPHVPRSAENYLSRAITNHLPQPLRRLGRRRRGPRRRRHGRAEVVARRRERRHRRVVPGDVRPPRRRPRSARRPGTDNDQIALISMTHPAWTPVPGSARSPCGTTLVLSAARRRPQPPPLARRGVHPPPGRRPVCGARRYTVTFRGHRGDPFHSGLPLRRGRDRLRRSRSRRAGG